MTMGGLFYHNCDGCDPYGNLALEEHVTRTIRDGECVLLLWRNDKTVVIGRNQNLWRECRVAELENDGGRVARRLSGGGAVYHDMGNLNFSFIAREGLYDIAKQTETLVRAVSGAGIKAEVRGRNDVTAGGRKFSGHAFFSIGANRCHHGTILIRSDMEAMMHYLSAQGGKIHGRGVESVRSRVVNLHELNNEVTVESISSAMVRAFGDVYGARPMELPRERLTRQDIERARRFFSSREWRYGKIPECTWEAEEQLGWGHVCLRLSVREGIVTESLFFSDAMDADYIQAAGRALEGAAFGADALTAALDAFTDGMNGLYADKTDDIKCFIRRNL